MVLFLHNGSRGQFHNCHLPKKQDRLKIEAEDFDFFNKNSIRWEGSLLFTRVQDSRYPVPTAVGTTTNKDLQFCHHLPKKQDRLKIEAEDFDFFNKNSIRWEGSLLFTRVQDSRYLPQLVQQQGPTILHTADSIQLDSSASR